MKKIKYIIIALVLILLTTACGLNLGTRTFKSKSGVYEIQTNGAWAEATAGSLNQNADLELRGLRIEKYAMIITDEASHFENYTDWLNTVITNNANNYPFDASAIQSIEVAGYDSKYVEFTTEIQNDDPYDEEHPTFTMYMRIYFLNGKNYYAQMFMWTLEENKTSSVKDFEEMVNSLKILK